MFLFDYSWKKLWLFVYNKIEKNMWKNKSKPKQEFETVKDHKVRKWAFNSYEDKMRGEGVKKWQNSVHIVVEWPQTETDGHRVYPRKQFSVQKNPYIIRKNIVLKSYLCKVSTNYFQDHFLYRAMHHNHNPGT